jgi:hypothetical protein
MSLISFRKVSLISTVMIIFFSVIFVVVSFPINIPYAKPGKYYSSKSDMLENTLNSLPDLSSLKETPLDPDISDNLGVLEEVEDEPQDEYDPYSDILDMNAVIAEKV